MNKEEAIARMRGAACSKTARSELAHSLSEAQALKLVRHYVKCLPEGAELGPMVAERVMIVSRHKRTHS